ncbi:siphovirus Gp157 family protein [Paenibacillus spiritus]|uniref:Siphovirus Gp157 family protein n=1 Tax=Paenibacillus spiritus TaxID=2496557 RepID=A0A5J5GGR9_9BACL|nr:siphovirus Gp157 family protein [Paenibacillus spiritus]KAA9007287.1 siphovirus Gp157 family protein [Paenibacillus spiritus]
MPSLYSLSEQYKFLNEFVDAALSNDEMTEDDIEMYKDTLESIEDEMINKCDNIAKFITNLNGDIEAYKAEEARLNKKRKYLENKQKWLKEYMQGFLELNNTDKVNTGVFTVKLQKNPPSLNVLDESKIPDTYKIPQPAKVDTKLLLVDVKAGKLIDGVVLVTDKKHLRIT